MFYQAAIGVPLFLCHPDPTLGRYLAKQKVALDGSTMAQQTCASQHGANDGSICGCCCCLHEAF